MENNFTFMPVRYDESEETQKKRIFSDLGIKIDIPIRQVNELGFLYPTVFSFLRESKNDLTNRILFVSKIGDEITKQDIIKFLQNGERFREVLQSLYPVVVESICIENFKKATDNKDYTIFGSLNFLPPTFFHFAHCQRLLCTCSGRVT